MNSYIHLFFIMAMTNIIIYTILFLCLLIETILFITYIKKDNSIRQKYYNLNIIQADITDLIQQRDEIICSIEEKKQEYNTIYTTEREKIAEQIEIYKQNSSYAAEQYINKIEEKYAEIEQQHDLDLIKLHEQEQQYNQNIENLNQQIIDLTNTLTAGVRAQLRKQEEKEKLNFYKLTISNNDLEDIKKLENIKISLYHPDILSKLIWTTYFQKQATELCNRVLGTDKKCGIYKITDLITEQYYIGQSVNIADRFKQHIKCGLGIDAPSTNKLYSAMQKDGIWNFTFEVLEECSKDQLNEKESFWIQSYKAYDFGLNQTRGNKI